MEKREWYQIVVHFVDGYSTVLTRDDFEMRGSKTQELQAIQAIRDFAQVLNNILGEAEG